MEPIAITGIAGLFPGAPTLNALWQRLEAKQQTATDATELHFSAPPGAFYDPSRQRADTTYFLRGGHVDAFAFDADGYRLPADYLTTLTDAVQWTLHTARGALADSGGPDADLLKRTGLILGNLSLPTRHSKDVFIPLYDAVLSRAVADLLDAPHLDMHDPHEADWRPQNAFSPGFPAAVASAALGLGKMHIALDAACGSSLYAVALACDMLNSRRADLMLAGAVSAADPLYMNLGFAHLGGFPDDGQASRPLDRQSGGLIVGEGAGMVVLKRYAEALRDGDHIYAVIVGAGLANDGAGKHILTPNSKGQIASFERAYADAGIAYTEVDYVECHASGTPLGDRTELASMAAFFKERSPQVGSVKSNLGHLMTAAGMASISKVVLALAHERIPPTVGVGDPLRLPDNPHITGQIIAEAQPWPKSNARYAGINAFGFGGVNAHLVLADPGTPNLQAKQDHPMTNQHGSTRMAIVGMDTHFGPLDGLEAFAASAFDGKTAFVPLPESRWKGLQHQTQVLAEAGLPDGEAPRGAYIESFDLDFMQVRIPPNPDDEPIPQQLLLLKVADRAIRDAGLERGANVAVLVALGTELALHRYRERADMNWKLDAALNDAGLQLSDDQREALRSVVKDSLLSSAQVNHYTSYIGNIAASRVSSLWDFSGPSFTVSAEENSVFKALDMAQMLLAKGEVDAVVVGAVDLAGSFESVLMRNALNPLHQGKPAAGFDANSTGWLVGEGAGAVVLTRDDALASHEPYAIIDALEIVQGDTLGTPYAATIAAAATGALRTAGVSADEVGYVELHASGIQAEDQAEIAGITSIYRSGAGDLTTAAGSAKSRVGHTFAASGMASLINAALAVGQRFIPAVPDWTAPELPEQWTGTPFWVATKSRTWFDEHRVAAVSGLGIDGAAAHVILSSTPGEAADNGYLRHGSPVLIPVALSGENDLAPALDVILRDLAEPGDLQSVADAAYDRALAATNVRYVLALVAKSADALRTEIDRARDGVQNALATGTDWTTPAGSAFSPRPVGQDGHVAFVYPGAFNSYPKMGTDLFHLFPHTLDTLAEVKQDTGEAVAERLLYPRSLEKPSAKLTRQMKTALADDAIATIESGLSFALIYTRAMRDVLGVHPGAAFGYSLGEGSMMWGMGAWQDGDAGSAAFRDSDVFTSRLVGPMQAVRDAWGVSHNVPSEQIWAAYFIAAPVEQVRAAIEGERRAYITHVNTPTEVMIAGDPAACDRVLSRLSGEAVKAPFSVVIHNDAMMSEFGEFFRLHDLPVTPVDGDVRFYSAADYAPIALDRRVIATSIARMVCKPVDFARLIRTVYDDGARVFVELGPRSTCARWVDETLGDAPHVAVSIDQTGSDSRTSVIKMLASLVAHRVPLSLEALYHPSQAETAPAKSVVRSVQLGGPDIYAAIANAEIADIAQAPRQQPDVGRHEATVPAVSASMTTPATMRTPTPDGLDTVHADFLRTRKSALRQMGEMIRAQIAGGETPPAIPSTPPAPPSTPVGTQRAASVEPQLPAPPEPNPVMAQSVAAGKQPFFTFEQIDTFALRRIADTFGERYAVYDGRRAPRIPNGDLLLISRVVDIQGERFNMKAPTSIHTEYDVPVNAWYYRDNPYPSMPYVVLMEIALQPCGILSAYHGPTLPTPEIDFYFRNLDGNGRLVEDRDMRGRTITNKVKLTNNTILAGTIIQSFTFELYDGDALFYEGAATFGYFTLKALDSQAGLDAGKRVTRWIDDASPANVIQVDPKRTYGEGYLRLAGDQLAFTDDIRVVPDGGENGQGYAYANTIIVPDDWFFKNHFHEDPVMPGSIGVETIMQAMQAYVIATGLADDLPYPHFGQADGDHTTTWKYRGQVLGTAEKTHVEAHIKAVEHRGDEIVVIADGSLWRDDLRIYAVTDLALAVRGTR